MNFTELITSSSIHPKQIQDTKDKERRKKKNSKQKTCLSWGILAFSFAIATARESPPIASTKPLEAASLPVQTLPCATSSILST